MARMPGAIWQGEHGGSLMSRYDIVCVHTIVGFAPAHAAHFSTKADGTIFQSRDTRYKSAANLYGNHRVIAIENEDHGSAFGSWNTGDGHAVPALTRAQVEANARILRWAHDTHGVPLQMCPNSRPESRGLAYHRQGIDGNFSGYAYPGRVSGGEVWTKSYGKVCPGDRKIAQLPEILRLALGGTMPPPDDPPEEEDEDMRLPVIVVKNDPQRAVFLVVDYPNRQVTRLVPTEGLSAGDWYKAGVEADLFKPVKEVWAGTYDRAARMCSSTWNKGDTNSDTRDVLNRLEMRTIAIQNKVHENDPNQPQVDL